MKIILLLFSILAGFGLLAQKINFDEEIAYVDAEPYIKYEKKNMANEASVQGLTAEGEEIYVSFQSYTNPNLISKSNPEGKERWMEINFLTLGIHCEISNRTHKGVVKLLYENNIYVNGLFNPENAEKMVRKFGTKFTDNKPGGVTIIINH